ncbi:hypothetical protein P4V86_03385 [Brevibacillus laterosporus]|uniref:hypothetical protein n=1 Tax=Brevibacillus laterosporus TaxID=1465 RepID=UPI000369261B|nr:hypothetical protein [Brevibacillus laterosporus]ATO48565.1 hypothetical protein BrL25_05215 [Brevibacillus laterosporus DSM 25]MED2002401.1 hypothetical protein [Brevibacillus laterosporus]
MDIVSFSKAAKVEREVKQARDSYASLDSRLDAVSIGNVVSVKLKTELPSNGEIGRLYLVRQDSGNQNNPTTYTYSGGEYVKASGDRVSNHADNGALTINGSKTVVYTHPDTHSADILTDGNSKVAMTVGERDKLKAIEDEANKYVHPDNHSADMITDGVTNVSMTVDERAKLNVIDQWDAISDLVEYKDVVTYSAFDGVGRVVRQVVTDYYVEQNVKEPMLTIPDNPDGFTEGESFLVTSIGEIYLFDGTDFVVLPTLVDVVYQYDAAGLLENKSISTMGATPTQTHYRYIYDSKGNRIAVKKY